mmetsp:Transcript_56539/g.183791  ORF Transcript_56539/g.183791 Transcript_56539/m.183791 type:complete len:467 (+) Transcript_56539:261-1661(+)
MVCEATAGEAPAALTGCVLGVRRHGKNLAFLRIEKQDSCEQVDLAFNAEVFDHAGSPQEYPVGKRDVCVGDLIRIDARSCCLPSGDVRLCIERWTRCAVGVETSNAIRQPAGKAVCSGWVCCPLCPSTSMRRFNFGPGLRHHLDMVHVEGREAAIREHGDLEEAVREWHQEVSERAAKQGVFSKRSAAGRAPAEVSRRRGSMEGRGEEAASKVQLPFLLAARDGDVALLASMLAEGWRPFDLPELDHNGASALDWAAGAGHLACVELLLPHASGVQASRRDGRGPAHVAARFGRAEVLARLLEARADINVRTTNGTSMLMLAGYGGHMQSCSLLAERSADLDARNSWDCDVGHFAAMGGSVETCEWLRGSGMPLDRRQSSGHTALHKAADSGCQDVVRYLLENGLTPGQLERIRNTEGFAKARASVPEEDADLLAVRRRREAHLPSALARKQGHETCAELLSAVGL